MYDYVNARLPATFDFTWKTNYQELGIESLRNIDDFYQRRVTYTYLDNHPLFYFPSTWNDLPDDIKLIGNKSEFASRVKTFLFSKVNQA